MGRSWSKMLVLTGVAGAVAVAWRRVVDPWQRTWGATEEEVGGALPGDDLVGEPAVEATRAVTVEAPPEAVWPWVAQLGADRGGFYSYDWLENLAGLGVHSARRVVPAWQGFAEGDVVYADAARTGGWRVAEVVPGRALVLQVVDVRTCRPLRRAEGLGGEFIWTFVLVPAGSGRTRLVVRERVATGNPLAWLARGPVGLASFVMTRRMLLGLRARAEAREAARTPLTVVPAATR